MKLGSRFARGSLLFSAGSWSANAANLALQLVLARLLGPTIFGLYAFCFAISEFINIVGAFSLQHALIQRREVDPSDYDTAFVICAGLGLAGVLLAAGVGPFLAEARGADAAWVLLLMAVANLARLLAQPPQAQLERALRYGAITMTSTIAAVVPNLIAVGLAWWGLGLWSLALRDLLVGVSFLVFSLWASDYRFRFRVARSAWQRLMDYSKPMFVSRTLEILMERMDLVAVGFFLGNRTAGLYHWARNLSEIGYLVTRPLERVSLNLYSRLQDDPIRLARSVNLVNSMLLRVLLLGSVVLLIFPTETVRLLLGEEWLGVAPILRWLGLYAGLLPIAHNVKVLFYGLGEVRSMARIRLEQTVVFGFSVLVAISWESASGVAAVLMGSTLLLMLLQWLRIRSLVDLDVKGIGLVPIVVAALTVGLFSVWGGALAQALPWYLLPFLPPVILALGLGVVEGRRLAADVGFLVRQLRGVSDLPARSE